MSNDNKYIIYVSTYPLLFVEVVRRRPPVDTDCADIISCCCSVADIMPFVKTGFSAAALLLFVLKFKLMPPMLEFPLLPLRYPLEMLLKLRLL